MNNAVRVHLHETHAPPRRGNVNQPGKLRPHYPESRWDASAVAIAWNLAGSYWHPLEVIHLHAVARGVLTAQQIHDRRILPGVGLRDIVHHLDKVRLPDPASLRVRSRESQGQLKPAGRALLLAYFAYLKQTRQFMTLASIAELFNLSPALMSSLCEEAGWNRESYYAFRKAAYRELVGRYSVTIPGAEDLRASDVVIASHASSQWNLSAHMIHRNLLPHVPPNRILEVAALQLPVIKLSGQGLLFEWFDKIPSRKLLFDVLRDHPGVIPRWELASTFNLTDNSLKEILAAEGLDLASMDTASERIKNSLRFYVPGLDARESVDCLHVQILKLSGLAPKDIVRLHLVARPPETISHYLTLDTGLHRARLPLARRESHDLDLLTASALHAYLSCHAGEVEQRFVEQYFGVCHSVLRQAWKRSKAPSGRWSTYRKGLASRHFDSLDRLFGMDIPKALDALHHAVTMEATGVTTDLVAAARLLERIEASNSNADELKALVRQYLHAHPGVPLGPLAAVTGLTPRILSNLRPPAPAADVMRNDGWKQTFKQSEDFRIWTALREDAGLPLNGWKR